MWPTLIKLCMSRLLGLFSLCLLARLLGLYIDMMISKKSGPLKKLEYLPLRKTGKVRRKCLSSQKTFNLCLLARLLGLYIDVQK